jgi:TRAP-type transport system periplasmic protein
VANKRAWENLPPDLRTIVERNFNDSAMAQREDVARLNQSLRQQLVGHGMIFNDPDPEPFKNALTKAGYYREWRERFGPEAWALLEKYAGKLA